MSHVNADLLAVLRCPVTGSALTQDGDQLVAARDKDDTRYDIVDGIPVLLPPSDRPAESSRPSTSSGRHRADHPIEQ